MASIIRDVDVPYGMGTESVDGFCHDGVLIFTHVTFVNCRFNFTSTNYVFMYCQFLGCDLSTLSKDRLLCSHIGPKCLGLIGYNCPPTGAFEAWKACVDVWTYELVLAKLFVPEEANRVTVPFERKCRVSVARVMGLYFADGSESKKAFSIYDPAFSYEPDAVLVPKGEWKDDSRCCGAGIHIFTDPYDAISYGISNGHRCMGVDMYRLGVYGRPEIVHREDGSCPYPLRMAPGFPRGEWEWVGKLLYKGDK